MITRSLFRSSLLAGVLSLTAGAAFADVQARDLRATYAHQPLQFEANQGQARDDVKFLARGPGYGVYLTANEAVLALSTPSRDDCAADDAKPESGRVVRMSLRGGAKAPAIHAVDEQPAKANYLVGSDSSKWRTQIPTYAKVKYDEVYPGIDVAYYGTQRQLEYDFVLAPGADPRSIEIEFAGADSVEIDANGDLVLHACDREIRQPKPLIYQEANGRREIAGGYVRHGKNRIGFSVAAYDRSAPLVIDPVVLSYATFLGGSSYETGNGVAIDGQGSAYVTGRTTSADFPVTPGAYQTSAAGAFVTKFNADGSLAYSTYLGGSLFTTEGRGIAVDSSGNAYVTGITTNGFPTTPGAYQTASANSNTHGFVLKLDPSGSALVYSTLLAGTGSELPEDIAIDSAGAAYVTGGNTPQDDFAPSPNGFQQPGARDFVVKLDPTGSALVYSARFGPLEAYETSATANAIALDRDGNAYVTGIAFSGFPVTANAFQTQASDGAFVMKLGLMGELVYSTYLGSGSAGYGIAADTGGNAYVVGTAAADFPTTPGAYRTAGGVSFVAKLNAVGSGLVYSTRISRFSADVAVDESGRAYVAGGEDEFVTVVDPSGSTVSTSGINGGPATDKRTCCIALDATARNMWVVGTSNSWTFPTTWTAYQPTRNGSASGSEVRDAFAMKFTIADERSVPGTLEAEDFNQGGEGAGYHELTPGNQGNAEYRRSEDVDIFVSNDRAGGGRIIKNFESGEWLAYTINVQTSGTYDVELRAATSSAFPNSSYYVQIDGINVSGIVTLPDTGGWDSYRWIGKSTISLTAGTHLLRIVAENPYFALNSIRVSSTVMSSPYYGTPTAVPGEFEAEAFDAGGEGVAYHDNSPGNQGDTGLRAGEDVDIFVSNDAQSGSPYIVKNMEAGEWLDYTISVPTSGNYDVELRAATSVDFPNPAYHVEVDGVNVSGTVTLPDTGGWDNYQWIGRTTVALTAGTHVLKVVSERPYFGLNSIRLTTTGANGPTPNAVPGVIEAENFDAGGEGPGYHENTPGNQGNAGFRTAEDVDIFSSNDGGSGSWYIVKNFEADEWLAYTISVPTSGNYDVELRAATNVAFPNRSYYVQVDGSNVSGGVITLPDTGGWDQYQWIGKSTIALTAGTHLMRIVTVQPYFGFNSFRVLHHSP